MTDKPRFYLMDLDNYTSEFLQEIILWYDEELKRLQEESKEPNLDNGGRLGTTLSSNLNSCKKYNY